MPAVSVAGYELLSANEEGEGGKKLIVNSSPVKSAIITADKCAIITADKYAPVK